MNKPELECPYCQTKKSGFEIIYKRYFSGKYFNKQIEYYVCIGAICPDCHNTALFKLLPRKVCEAAEIEGENSRMSRINAKYSISDKDGRLLIVIKPADGSGDGEFLPVAIEGVFSKAKERQVDDQRLDEAAATYRQTLECAIKVTHPDIYGAITGKSVSLREAIFCLVEQHFIPASLGKLAQNIRLIGKDDETAIGSEEVVVRREDVEEIAIFTEAFLTYLIFLPYDVILLPHDVLLHPHDVSRRFID